MVWFYCSSFFHSLFESLGVVVTQMLVSCCDCVTIHAVVNYRCKQKNEINSYKKYKLFPCSNYNKMSQIWEG